MAKNRRTLSLAGGLLLGFLSASPAAATGPTFVVNSYADEYDLDVDDDVCKTADNVCTLRAAVDQANATSGATIQLPGGPFTLTKSPLDVRSPMTFQGAGMYRTTLDAFSRFGIMVIYDVAGDVTVSDMFLVNGNALGDGGAIRSFGSKDTTLRIRRCWFENNRGPSGGAVAAGEHTTLLMNASVLEANRSTFGAGGAIVAYNGTITSTTISSNTAATWAGGVHVVSGTVNFVNCTISANDALAGGGGGIEVGSLGTARLYSTTVANNSASGGYGGGISNEGSASGVTLLNSIVAVNFRVAGGVFFPEDCNGEMSSYGNSIVSKPPQYYCWVSGSYAATDALLAPLAYNGGGRFTHALLPGSPAIDAGKATGCTNELGNPLFIDERGVRRPIGTACDIGAFEVEPCGDVNGDGVVNVGDALFLVNHLFASGAEPAGRGGDANGDGSLDVGDVLYLINYLFAGGPAPQCPTHIVED